MTEVPERSPPIRNAPLGAACRAVPDNRVAFSHAGVYVAVVAFAALEAHWSKRILRPVEIRRVGDHRGDEIGHLAGWALLGPNVAFLVEVVSSVYHVHDICSSSPPEIALVT